MGYTRAPASDFDDWGVEGWESKNLLPLMKKVLQCVVCVLLGLNY
jgi:alcohol oxidase